MGIELEVSDKAKRRLAEEGNDPTYGARPLRRAVVRQLEDPLSEEYLKGRFQAGQRVRVDYNDEKGFTFEAVGTAGKTAPGPAKTAAAPGPATGGRGEKRRPKSTKGDPSTKAGE